MANINALQKLVDSRFRLAAIETPNPLRMMDLFKRFNSETGRAIYTWAPHNGLSRIGLEHILIPKTREPRDLMNYIASARHFGVYVVFHYEDMLQDSLVQQTLLRIASKEDGIRRLMVLVGQRVDIPVGLQPIAAKMQHSLRGNTAQQRQSVTA